MTSLRGMHFAEAAARGLRGCVYIYWLIHAFLEDCAAGLPRAMIPSKHAVRSFVKELVLHVGSKWYPKSTARLFETRLRIRIFIYCSLFIVLYY